MGNMFDLEALARNVGLSRAKARALMTEVRKEFPEDELLFELHVVRAIMHEKDLHRSKSLRRRRRLGSEIPSKLIA